MKIPIVELSGTHREQGRQHGEALAPVIAQIISEVLTWDQFRPDRVEWVLGVVEANMQRHAPGLVEEMRGIAEGSGLPYRDILAYNALADIWMANKFCTAIGWADTPDGPIIGKTNDIGQDKAKYHQPYRRRSGDGIAGVWATWPGTVWINAVVNARGLAGGGASLGMEARNEAGVPSNSMWRVQADSCGSVDELLALSDRVPVMHHPQHNVIADMTGTLLTIELTPEGVFVCQGPGEQTVRATNHFCPGPFEGRDNGEERHVINSKNRFANLARLTAALPHTVEGMKQLLQDHAAPGGICQHGDADMWSSTAYILIPSQRAMLIARGQPCETQFEEVAL